MEQAQAKGAEARLWICWSNMRQRCYNPNHKQYRNYGAREIKICDEWKDYPVFKKWALSNGYTNGMTIDRRDNDKNYSPENCQWLTNSANAKKEHVHNRIKKLRKWLKQFE